MSRGKPLSFDREEVLQSAMELFWRRGYEATGITELIETMGIPRQSFYNTFGSKEEILFEAIDRYGAFLRTALRETIGPARTPFGKIDRLFAFWERTDGKGCFLGNCVAEFGSTRDKVAEKLALQLNSLREIFGGIFQEAIDRGDLPADRSARVMAQTMIACSQGLALLIKSEPQSNSDKELICDTIEFMKQSLKR